jgi:hypothetical protein
MRCVLILSLIALFLGCTQSDDSQAPQPAPTYNVQLVQTSGAVAETFSYTETIVITGNQMQVSRIGGSSVRKGSQTVTLTVTQQAEVLHLAGLIDAVADADRLLPSLRVGGGRQTLNVRGISSSFMNGIRTDGTGRDYEFAPDCKNLSDNVNALLHAYGFDVRIEAGG